MENKFDYGDRKRSKIRATEAQGIKIGKNNESDSGGSWEEAPENFKLHNASWRSVHQGRELHSKLILCKFLPFSL